MTLRMDPIYTEWGKLQQLEFLKAKENRSEKEDDAAF